MSDTQPLNYTNLRDRSSSLTEYGGVMGIAASLTGMLIFVFSCFGFEAVLICSPVPVLLGIVGLVMTIVGVVTAGHGDEGPVVAALFCNFFGIAGGLLEMAAKWHWPILPIG